MKIKNFFTWLWSKIKEGASWLWKEIKKFLSRAFLTNSHIWFYAAGGGLFGLLAQKVNFIHTTLTNTSYGFVDSGLIMLFVFLVMIKVYVASEMRKSGKTIKQLFGGYFNYIANCFGDIVLSLVSALFVLLV